MLLFELIRNFAMTSPRNLHKAPENHSGSADMECDPKIELLYFILDQSMHNSFLRLVCKKSQSHQKYRLKDNVVDSLQSVAIEV